MTDDSPIVISDPNELLSKLAGVHSRVFQLHCLRTSDDDPAEPAAATVTPAIQMRGSSEFQEIRLQIRAERSDVDVTVEVGFQFTWTEPLTYENPQKLAVEFAHAFGLKYAVDYVRPLMDDLARAVDVPAIALLHDVAERWRISTDDESADDSGDDSRARHRSKH